MALSAGEITAIIAVAGNMGAWAKLFSDQRKYAKAGNGNGNGSRYPCGLHVNLAERVGKIEGAAERLRTDMSTAHQEDRDCFNRIFQGLETVKVDAAVTREKATSAQASVKEIAETIERRKNPR
jgi:hypothetical protein